MTKTGCGGLLLAAFLVAPVQGQQQAPRIDVSRRGPQVGQRVPDFRLPDSHGELRTRDSLFGPNGAMLVFSRSLDWCPYCKAQAIDLQARVPELRAKGLGRDILNTTVDQTSTNFGIPFPGTFVVDRRGFVKARFFEEAYQERTTVATIMLALGSGGPPTRAQRITANQLELTAYLTDEVVAPGSLFSIVFDVQPRPGMHVYAPGAKGYRIIEFTIESNPLIVSRPVSYPAPEIYFFEPLNERVPVFHKPFRLTQALAISTAPQHRAAVSRLDVLDVKGIIEYQACDDRICYTPESVPVSFAVKVRQLDGERSTVRQ